MAKIPTQMDVLHNQTFTDKSGFQHNETNVIQNSNHSNNTGDWDWDGDVYWDGDGGGDRYWEWYLTQVIIYWFVFFIAFPGICFALYKLCAQVRPDQVAPVYVINLLISDLIQVCANPINMTLWYCCKYMNDYCQGIVIHYSHLIYLFGVLVNVSLMMCVSAERYVMIAHAIWYRNIQNRKLSVIVSVIIWILPAVIVIILNYEGDLSHMGPILLVPYPVVMFFFVATWRALSRSSVPRNDQIRIRAILGLILCIYTILFLPYIIFMFYPSYMGRWHVSMAYILAGLNPLFDLLLYVLIRKDVSHVLRALLFCCNKRHGENIANGSDTAT